MKKRLFDTILKKGLNDLKLLIDEIVNEEKKMHESL